MEKIRSLFISDVHLGSPHAAVGDLLNFLTIVKENNNIENLYIVGDFIDGWKLKRNWYWTDECNLIIRKILSYLRRKTTIYYVCGNHDEFMREFIHDFHLSDFGSIHLGNEFIHETLDGKKFLVTHGDAFDLVTKYAHGLCVIGDLGYEFLLNLNTLVAWTRRKLHLPYWSLSNAVKSNVKQAVNYLGDFETSMTNYGRKKDCDGCVCGHIHTAALKELNDGFIYANTGDWIESRTAIYEDYNGNLNLYYHHGENNLCFPKKKSLIS